MSQFHDFKHLIFSAFKKFLRHLHKNISYTFHSASYHVNGMTIESPSPSGKRL